MVGESLNFSLVLSAVSDLTTKDPKMTSKRSGKKRISRNGFYEYLRSVCGRRWGCREREDFAHSQWPLMTRLQRLPFRLEAIDRAARAKGLVCHNCKCVELRVLLGECAAWQALPDETSIPWFIGEVQDSTLVCPNQSCIWYAKALFDCYAERIAIPDWCSTINSVVDC